MFVDSQGESKDNTKSNPNSGSDAKSAAQKQNESTDQTEEEIAALFNPYLPISMFKKQKSSFVCWQVFTAVNQVWLTFIGFSTFNKE